MWESAPHPGSGASGTRGTRNHDLPRKSQSGSVANATNGPSGSHPDGPLRCRNANPLGAYTALLRDDDRARVLVVLLEEGLLHLKLLGGRLHIAAGIGRP